MRWRPQQEAIHDPFLYRVVERIDVQAAKVAMAMVPTGARLSFDDAWTLPSGYLRCDGSTVRIGDYKELYDVIGWTYGGAGGTTFDLPTTADTIIKT